MALTRTAAPRVAATSVVAFVTMPPRDGAGGAVADSAQPAGCTGESLSVTARLSAFSGGFEPNNLLFARGTRP
jgi:hypothetical protein